MIYWHSSLACASIYADLIGGRVDTSDHRQVPETCVFPQIDSFTQIFGKIDNA